jgi:transposase InsO family protein
MMFHGVSSFQRLDTAFLNVLQLGAYANSPILHQPCDTTLLNGEILYTLKEAKVLIEQWRNHYNTVRPHSALGYRPPAPSTFAPHRGDTPFAMDGLRAIAARQTPSMV